MMMAFFIRHDSSAKLADLAKHAGVQDSFLGTYFDMVNSGLKAANLSINSEEFRKVMKEESFDLVIVGMFTNNFLIGKYPNKYFLWLLLTRDLYFNIRLL